MAQTLQPTLAIGPVPDLQVNAVPARLEGARTRSVHGPRNSANTANPRWIRSLCHNLSMLVLASASPRRRELLTQAGFTFEVHPADIPEDPYPNEDPIAYVLRLARQKAEAVFASLTTPGVPSIRGPIPNGWAATNPGNPNDQTLTVLGADTTVVIDDQILGKPTDPADAARMLRLLSGRTHRVITGVAIVTSNGTKTAAEVTTVTCLPLSEEIITAYIATGEPMDKAGAYAIQGRAARWIPRIEGDYSNVVGLPLSLVTTLLGSGRP